jgi:glucose/arabinose dehydrogenase
MNMKPIRWLVLSGSLACGAALFLRAAGPRPDFSDVKNVITGTAAFDSYKTEEPGTFRKITVADLPKPYATEGVGNPPHVVPRPADAWPKAPQGFKVELFTNEGLAEPRAMRSAPNGDLLVADTHGNKIHIFRGITPDGKPQQRSVFTSTGLHQPFGMAFYPSGNNPEWLYIGNTDSVVRFPYHSGDLEATGAAQVIVPKLPTGGHSTRDLAFSPDGTKLFVSVGSNSNVDDPDTTPKEFRRANILQYTPDGKFVKVYASGIRNPVGIAVNPQTGELWCSTNERDMLGDNLVPDYITHVQPGGFYGWPFYHPELKDKVIVPDVLLQPHNASLELAFYEGSQFPQNYKGDIFAAEHGSWNKSVRAGYEVVRVPLNNGKADGTYEDFLTGFVTPEGNAWGRPVGVAVAPDGSLMVSDDGSKSIWRVSYTGK